MNALEEYKAYSRWEDRHCGERVYTREPVEGPRLASVVPRLVQCPACGGRGEYHYDYATWGDIENDTVACGRCHGDGKIAQAALEAFCNDH